MRSLSGTSEHVGSVIVTDPRDCPDLPTGMPPEPSAEQAVPSSVGAVHVGVVRLDPDLELPRYAHDDDAGADLVARVEVTIAPGGRALVPTGVALAIPEGHAGFVHPRSGLAARHGISIVNAPGTVDAGYRGEIVVNLINLDPAAAFTVQRGDRIAQLVVQRVARAEFLVVDSLGETARGDTGHGSTGGFGSPESTGGAESSNQRTE